jgi:hypothetical protein
LISAPFIVVGALSGFMIDGFPSVRHYTPQGARLRLFDAGGFAGL